MIANSLEKILDASCMEGTNNSIKSELALISSKQNSIIFLSDITPNALINMNNGIGFLTFGITTTNWLFVRVVEGATILMALVLTGLDESSETERISAVWLYISLYLSLI